MVDLPLWPALVLGFLGALLYGWHRWETFKLDRMHASGAAGHGEEARTENRPVEVESTAVTRT